ncbi:MAG: hypothetical protein ACI3Z0_03220 [Candidatus Cryptobacteroides sp.]
MNKTVSIISRIKMDAELISQGTIAIGDAMNVIRKVFECYPEEMRTNHEKLFDNAYTCLMDARSNYIALCSHLLAERTLDIICVSELEEDKQ